MMLPRPNASRIALITGAASPTGIGACTARRLARDGWRLALLDRDPRVRETAGKIAVEFGLTDESVYGDVCDVADETDVARAVDAVVKAFGRIDLAVANAGIAGQEIDLVDQTLEGFDSIMAVNLRGVFLTCRAVGKLMRKTRSGSIVTISSIFGQEPFASAAAYSASKAGVIALTQALALELAPYGVRVNSISPGYIRTEMLDGSQLGRARRAGLTFDEEGERVDRLVPMGRHGTGDDIAGAIAFLASDDATYITGHTLGVTGGFVMR